MASSLRVSATARAPGQAHGHAKRHRTGAEERIDPRALVRRVIPRGISHEPTLPACPRTQCGASGGPISSRSTSPG